MTVNLPESIRDDLALCKHLLEREGKLTFSWKYIIIALHSALYHSMIIALRNSDGTGTRRDESREFTHTFDHALKHVQDKFKMGGPDAKALTLSEANRDALLRFDSDYRDQLVHTKPEALLLTKTEIIRLMPTIIDCIEFLYLKSGRVVQTEVQQREIASLLDFMRNWLAAPLARWLGEPTG